MFMSNNAYDRLGVAPGDIITFDDITEVVKFEDVIAKAVDPFMNDANKDAWAARNKLNDELKVPKFNGRLLDISLTVMPDPYGRLLTRADRGLSIQSGGNHERPSAASASTLISYTNFFFKATAKSSGKPAIGVIESELWYYPVALWGVQGNLYKQFNANFGRSLSRAVTKPKLEKDKFIEHDEAARRIGFKVLQDQIRRARSQPIHN